MIYLSIRMIIKFERNFEEYFLIKYIGISNSKILTSKIFLLIFSDYLKFSIVRFETLEIGLNKLV